MFVKNISLTLVFFFTFVLASSAQNIRVIDNKGTLQIFNPWRLNGNGGITAPSVPAVYGTTTIGNLESFLGTTDAKSLVFGTNNIERFRITDLGRLGIGTATPANQLEIRQGTAGNSGLRFTNLTSASAATTSSSKVLSVNAFGDVILTNVPGTQNIVDFSTVTPTTSGVVFTPNTPLDESVVYQSAVDNSFWTYNGTTYVTYTPPASTAWFTAGTTNDAGNSKTSNIHRTGNLGIGTNNPVNNLDVVGGFNLRNTPGAAGSNFGIEFNTNSNSPRIDWVFNGGYIGQFSSDANNFILHNSRTGSGGFRFVTNPGTGALDRLNILNSGNVGIGTANPLGRFVVNHNTYIGALPASSANLMDNTTFRPLARYQTTFGANNNAISHYMTTALAATQAHNYSLGTSLPYILQPAGGNVGIGTTSPSERLTVAAAPGTSANVGVYSMPIVLPTASDIILAQINLGPRNDYFGSIRSVLPSGSGGLDLSDIQIATGQASNNNTQVPRLTVKAITGNVGIGTTSPVSRFEVNGASTNTTAFNATTNATINFANSNLAYTSLSAQAFVLTGMKDGGTYTLSVQGTTSGTASFSGANPANAAFTFRSINNGATMASRHTLYTFVVMGTNVYFYMATGF